MKLSALSAIRHKQAQQGVTLVELVISIVILTIAMVAVLNSFSFSISHSADPLWRNKTLKLAQLYLDEILAKNYDENTVLGGVPFFANPLCTSLGPDAEGAGTETREQYDDVDDYHAPTNAVPTNLGGTLDSSYADYRISITVECADGSPATAVPVDVVDATDTLVTNYAKKITVIITPPNENPVTFAAYKVNF